MADEADNPQSFRDVYQSFPVMLLFDIDGVITNPITGEVASDVITEIARILDDGRPVAFNTGRGLHWILQDIFPFLKRQLSYQNSLNRLCIVYQKGAFRTSFDKAGMLEIPIVAPGVALIPSLLREAVIKLILSHYPGTMFPGETKEAVLSPQMRSGADYVQYKIDQQHLVRQLSALLHQSGISDQFRIDPTRIATDIEDKQLGKALGTRRILEWLEERKFRPRSFVAFGDSKSDIGMGEEIYSSGSPVTFVFVGEKEQLKDSVFPFPIYLTQALCEKGTIEYLNIERGTKLTEEKT